ncbi:DcaP family trimeric outer membrane transporter [Piscinibacter sp.]|jgi:hypothetical protein|uniref:DcaP family trimeric outer membrane transporter n=1 Tax=Piscinibacter sp. TaxID=1903157 RepID=UPI0035598D24
MTKTWRLNALHAAVAAASIGLTTAAHADPMQDLKAQIDSLSKKVAELEQKKAADAAQPAATPSNVVTGGATKGSFKLPGSDTSVTLGGYVKLDAIASSRSAGVGSTADQEYEAGNVPVGPTAGANERYQIVMHARQSRFNLKTSTPTGLGELTTFMEFDLFGGALSGNESVSNSHGLRVRHAYGTLGNLLVGQTWTTLFDVAAYPETVDFGGEAGVIFVRQAQARWTQPFSGGQWAVALENPETVASLTTGASFRADDDRYPDIVGNIKFNTSLGSYSLGAMARQLRVDSATAPASVDQKWGGVIGVTGVVPVLSKDDVRFAAYYGNAIGRYSVGFFTDAILDSSSHIVLPNQWLAMAAYRHAWNANLRSTISMSGLRSANPIGTAGSVNRAAHSAHVNLIWSPVAQANMGLEYIRATREIQNGQKGSLNRLQASAQYSF